MDLFAWVGEDETGDYGIKMVVTPLGASNAVFATRRMAEHPVILAQIQQIATVLNRPMVLIRVTETEELRRLGPQPQG